MLLDITRINTLKQRSAYGTTLKRKEKKKGKGETTDQKLIKERKTLNKINCADKKQTTVEIEADTETTKEKTRYCQKCYSLQQNNLSRKTVCIYNMCV